jgi:hypothetical protein
MSANKPFSWFHLTDRNLFLGYYLPFRHTMPLWEMESDYYLHNFHVKTGRGTSCSMSSYRRAFGIAWNELDAESPVSSPSLSRKSILTRRYSLDTVSGRGGEEPRRVQRVRNRCEAQNGALSAWWKHALQAHVQQRMWMQLGRNQAEIVLPPRFERVYQPENLCQFDRYFSRAWSTPVRRSHAAQHTEGVEDGDTGDLSRLISGGSPPTKNPDEATQAVESSGKVMLGNFTDKYGYEPWSESSLRRFSEYHSKLTTVVPDVSYIGNLEKVASTPREEYIRYLTPSVDVSEPPQRYRAETVQEFKECLQDYILGADDVVGIQKVSLQCIHLAEFDEYTHASSACRKLPLG